jgi:hypothetical protein
MSGDEIDGGPKRRRAGEAMIRDLGAIEEEKIVGAISGARERAVGLIKVELDFALRSKQRRADRATKIEIEAGGRAIRRLAGQSRARDAATANDA